MQICTWEKGICKRRTFPCFQQLFYYNKGEIKGGNGFHLTYRHQQPILYYRHVLRPGCFQLLDVPQTGRLLSCCCLFVFLRMKARAGEEVESWDMGQNSVGGSAKPGIRKDGRIVSCMFKDKTEAKKQSRSWKKREDVNRADLPNRYEQQGRYFYFFIFPEVPL